MKLSKKWFGLAVGTLALATVALVGTAIVPQSASAHGGPGGFGRGGIMAPDTNNTYLADALGITTDELATAQEEATTAALDQAVEEGLITQAQADSIKENGARFPGAHGLFGHFGSSTIDMEALLADALGITTDELQAARTEASSTALDAAVEAGDITQEQADQMKAHQALQQYLYTLLEKVLKKQLKIYPEYQRLLLKDTKRLLNWQ